MVMVMVIYSALVRSLCRTKCGILPEGEAASQLNGTTISTVWSVMF